MKKLYQDKNWLRKRYWEEGLSAVAIAKEHDVSTGTIIYYMKKYGISRRNKSEAAVGERNGMYGKTHTEEYKKILAERTKLFFDNPANRKLWSDKTSGENNGMFGKKHTPEARKKMSNAVKERCENPEHRERISAAARKKFEDNPELKRNLSEAAKKRTGKKNPFYGKKHTQETKDAISTANTGKFRGEKGANWQGGKTYFNQRIRETGKYKRWRRAIMERDSYTCVLCGQWGGELQVDHIKPFSLIIKENDITTLEQADECKDLYLLDNGRVLCKPCHKETDTYLWKARINNEF